MFAAGWQASDGRKRNTCNLPYTAHLIFVSLWKNTRNEGRSVLKRYLQILGFALAVLHTVGTVACADVMDNAQFKIDGAVIIWGADPGSGAPIVADFIIDTGTGITAATSGDTDLIAMDPGTIVTGTLEPVSGIGVTVQGSPMEIAQAVGSNSISTDSNGDGVMDANDAFSAFGLRQITRTNTQRMEVSSSFFVASSVPFRIDGVATPVGGTTAAQMGQMRFFIDGVTLFGDDGIAFGSAAQYPNSGGPNGGRRNNNSRFSDMLTPVNIFVGNQRTAALRGTLAEQSVRFDLRYRYSAGNFDLSDGVFEAAAEFAYTVYIP
ncbi:MAG: hypothetical protein AAF638_10530 [Pseudomonadota bacterium]